MGKLMLEHDVCHVSVFPSWFGIGWVVIALAECTTIRVICGIPWQVNPNGWPCQGPLHVTPPIGIISLGAIALGPNCIGSKFIGSNFSGRNFIGTKFRAPRRGQWARDLSNAQVKMHHGIRWLFHLAPLLLHLDPAPAWFPEP